MTVMTDHALVLCFNFWPCGAAFDAFRLLAWHG